MPEANDEQMQVFCDTRLRRRAEQFRDLKNSMVDDNAALPDVYDRADGGAPWNDNRTDGPPKLLASQDVMVYNTILYNFLKICTEEPADAATAAVWVNDFRNNLAVFQSACVRPVND